VKTLRFFLLFTLVAQSFVTTALAKPSSLEFMTSQDLSASNANSNINLQNSGNTAATVYGLYVRQFSYVTPGQSCSAAVPIYPSSTNVTVGSVLMPIAINPGRSVAIGQNYLYNMILQAEYYVYTTIPSSPPGCALPGCTWGSDTTTYNWCIYLGALAPVSTSPGYTSNVPPSTDAASSTGIYDYNVVSNFITIGPISCNDQTLTCSAASPQTQPFSL
jgi:hypothetical protein